MDIKEKKKTNIILFTLLMIIAFLFITEFIIYGFVGIFLNNVVMFYPYGSSVISEAILAILVLIVLLIFKNSYIFTEEKKPFKKGLFYGLYFIVLSLIFILLFGIVGGGFQGGLSIINILIYCILIGICEEFLCRGWLLNEFLERFGDTKKGIWYSIIISAFIFGLIHLGNIFSANQDVFSTIGQVINAVGIGILFGLIYYKTQNIWVVVIFHALWDFSLLLGEAAPITSVTETIPEASIIALVFSLLILFTQLLNIIPHIKDIDAEPKKSSVIAIAFVSSILYIVFFVAESNFLYTMGDTYEYGEMNLNDYGITSNTYLEYKMNYNEYSFIFTTDDDNNLVLTNQNTNESITLDTENWMDYIIVNNNNYYILAYIDYRDSFNAFLNYIYINKADLSNDSNYLTTIKNNIQKYLLPDIAELVIISDWDENINYVAAYNADVGCYVLDNNSEYVISRLN